MVVATGTHREPKRARLRLELDPQICSCTRPTTATLSQLRDGGVLVVGASNSGAEIALECRAADIHRPGLPSAEFPSGIAASRPASFCR